MSSLSHAPGAAALDYPMVPDIFTVQEVEHETNDTFTFTLTPRDHSHHYHFQPGQFNMVYVFGRGECAISICGDPALPETVLHTIRNVGTVTQALSELREGDEVGLRGPFGSVWPLEAAKGKDLVLIAGGIGLAPLRPTLYQALANRDHFSRVVLLYGARTPQDILYERELEQWAHHNGVEIFTTVDRADTRWRGHVGVVTKLIHRAQCDPAKAVAMVCGPEVMMRFTVMELQAHGVSDSQIFISMERNMKCAIGFCGYCQFGPTFICREGPVFRFDQIKMWFEQREI